jgi:hypothetical protein
LQAEWNSYRQYRPRRFRRLALARVSAMISSVAHMDVGRTAHSADRQAALMLSQDLAVLNRRHGSNELDETASLRHPQGTSSIEGARSRPPADVRSLRGYSIRAVWLSSWRPEEEIESSPRPYLAFV